MVHSANDRIDHDLEARSNDGLVARVGDCRVGDCDGCNHVSQSVCENGRRERKERKQKGKELRGDGRMRKGKGAGGNKGGYD